MTNKMNIPDEAVQEAAKKIAPHTKPGEMVYSASIASEALIAALPFLTGVKVKALDNDTMQKLRAALRFSASRSVMSSADEDRILSPIEVSSPDIGNPITLVYTNYRGETSERTITPIKPWFGSTEWHPEPQWLLTAFDHEKQANRDFALKDFGYPAPSPRAQALEEAAKIALDVSENGEYHGEASVDSTSSIYQQGAFDVYEAIRALSSQAVADGSSAARDVLAERRRQVEVEGWTPEHDDQWQSGEMAGAAACYALKGATYKAPSHYPPRKVYAAVAEARRDAEKDMNTTREAIRMAIGDPKAPQRWPWDAGWWKPSDRRRNLVKAAALILAEIERIDRLPSSPGASE